MIRVIVADDEYKVCQLICNLIKWEELDMQLIGTASNGVEALEMIEKEKPDLVLTDIRMPGCDGLELLKRARKVCSSVEFIIISGYSHFEYAQTAIQCGVSDYILKPINQDSLNATLQKVRLRYKERKNRDAAISRQVMQKEADVAKLRKTLWADMVSGSVEADRDKINDKYYYSFQAGIYQTFLILEGVRENRDIKVADAENIQELVFSKALVHVERYIKPICLEVELFNLEGQINGIVNYSGEQGVKIQEAFKNVIYSIGTDLAAFENLQFYMSMGQAVSTLEECFLRYSSAERAIGQHLFAENECIFREIPEETPYSEDIMYQPFCNSIKNGLDVKNEEQIGEAIEELKDRAISNGLNGYQMLALVRGAYRLFLLSSIFHSDFHFENREKMEADFNKRSMRCSSVEKLFLFLEDNCRENLKEACRWMDKEKIRPINQAKQYIQEHYAEALSLEGVSNQVGFSPSYFSTLFRKETGKTFVEHVTEVRIEEAKKLLRESHISIELISGMVGCKDSKRFSKTFKKAIGISQKEYRKLYS